MKHIIFITIILNIIFCQKIDFNKQFLFDSNHTTFKLIADSLYYIVSNTIDEKKINKKGLVVILNEKGQIKNKVKIGSKNNYIISGIKLQNNHFLFIGYNKENNDEWNRIYVVKTDQNLNMIWEKSYGPLNNDSKGYSIVEINENEYWILGHTKISNNGVLLLKIDDHGNEKWFSYLSNLNCNFANNMIATPNNDLIVSGQKNKELFISKINRKGQILWQYNYLNDKKYHRIYDIKNTKNGIIAVGNTTKNENHSYDILIIKLTYDGQEEWIQSFGNHTNEVAYDIERNKKNEYIITGYSLINKETKRYNSFLIKTDSIGNEINRIDFNTKYLNMEKTSNQLYDIIIKTEDNKNADSYLGAGNIFNEEGNSQIWFFKLKEK